MCKVKELCETTKKITIVTFDNTEITGDWFTDDERIKVDTKVNVTEAEENEYYKLLRDNNLCESDVSRWYTSRKREKDTIYITEHAIKRIRQRCGWNKKTALRMVSKVVDKGRRAEKEKGYVGKWMNRRLSQQQGEGYWNMIYGDHLYVFRFENLLTVFHMPNKGTIEASFA